MGNLLPIFGGLPFGISGVVWAFIRQEMLGWPLALFAMMPVAAWLLMNRLGLWENRAIRTALDARLAPPKPGPDLAVWYVGMARPSYHGLLDPHEDVGFLILNRESVEFRGEILRFKLAKKDLVGVRFRPNVHTMVGLGRWLSIEGKMEGKPIRMLIEPRERPTLLGNKRLSAAILDKLQGWLKDI